MNNERDLSSVSRRKSILLIRPPQTYYGNSYLFLLAFPIGLAQIAAVLERENYKVDVLDMLAAGSHIERSPVFTRYGLPFSILEAEIARIKPDLLGINCPFTSQLENAIMVARTAKLADKEIVVIIGGPGISAQEKELLLQESSLDIVVSGEGELTLLDILQQFNKDKRRVDDLAGINGIAYRENNRVFISPRREPIADLDSLPLPAYHLLDMESYLNPHKGFREKARQFGGNLREINIITSRGCPFNCIFCSIHLHMGRRWRGQSVGYVLEHIKYLISKYQVEFIHIEDDNFNFSQGRITLFDRMIKEGIKIKWDTPNGLRADDLDRKLLEKIKQSGCSSLTIGIESGSQAVLDKIIKKNLSLDKVVEVASWAKGTRLPLKAFFCIGFPGETVDDMIESLNFGIMLTKKYDLDWGFSIATPLPGTELYEICKKNGYFSREVTPINLGQATDESGTSLIRTNDFSPQDIKAIIRRRQRFELKHDFIRYLKSPYTAVKELFFEKKLNRLIRRVLER